MVLSGMESIIVLSGMGSVVVLSGMGSVMVLSGMESVMVLGGVENLLRRGPLARPFAQLRRPLSARELRLLDDSVVVGGLVGEKSLAMKDLGHGHVLVDVGSRDLIVLDVHVDPELLQELEDPLVARLELLLQTRRHDVELLAAAGELDLDLPEAGLDGGPDLTGPRLDGRSHSRPPRVVRLLHLPELVLDLGRRALDLVAHLREPRPPCARLLCGGGAWRGGGRGRGGRSGRGRDVVACGGRGHFFVIVPEYPPAQATPTCEPRGAGLQGEVPLPSGRGRGGLEGQHKGSQHARHNQCRSHGSQRRASELTTTLKIQQ